MLDSVVKVTGDPSDQVARDLQLVEFVNQKTMGDTIESLLEVKNTACTSAPFSRWINHLLVADRMALVVDLQAWNPHCWSEMFRCSHKRSQM